jgi:hypothetical protein
MDVRGIWGPVSHVIGAKFVAAEGITDGSRDLVIRGIEPNDDDTEK